MKIVVPSIGVLVAPAMAMILFAARPLRAEDIDWVDSIRQCWNDATDNDAISCYLTEGKLRARRSGKDCLVEAVNSVRANDRETALRWILACHCGTGREAVKQTIRDHDDEAVRFVVDTYGAFVQ